MLETPTEEFSDEEKQRWTEGAGRFREFVTQLTDEERAWLHADERDGQENAAALQWLFLRERPAALLTARKAVGPMPDALRSSLERHGFRCHDNFVYDDALLRRAMERHPDLCQDYRTPEELLTFLSGNAPGLSPGQFSALMGVVLGYPREATRRLHEKRIHTSILFRMRAKLRKLMADNSQAKAELAAEHERILREAKNDDEAARMTKDAVWETFVPRYAKELGVDEETVRALPGYQKEQDEITPVHSPFVAWDDRGGVSAESAALLRRLQTAAEHTGIASVRIPK